jgi:hypothetical protein
MLCPNKKYDFEDFLLFKRSANVAGDKGISKVKSKQQSPNRTACISL